MVSAHRVTASLKVVGCIHDGNAAETTHKAPGLTQPKESRGAVYIRISKWYLPLEPTITHSTLHAGAEAM